MKIDIDDFPRYARTDDGIKRIAKYIYHPEYENCHSLWFENETCGLRFDDEDLPKISDKIIDLMKVGDLIETTYVDPNSKLEKKSSNKWHEIKNEFDLNLQIFYLKEKRRILKSIITKEQFKKIEFRLEK